MRQSAVSLRTPRRHRFGSGSRAGDEGCGFAMAGAFRGMRVFFPAAPPPSPPVRKRRRRCALPPHSIGRGPRRSRRGVRFSPSFPLVSWLVPKFRRGNGAGEGEWCLLFPSSATLGLFVIPFKAGINAREHRPDRPCDGQKVTGNGPMFVAAAKKQQVAAKSSLRRLDRDCDRGNHNYQRRNRDCDRLNRSCDPANRNYDRLNRNVSVTRSTS